MKKSAIYITITALFLTLGLYEPVMASEVSGTISTGSGGSATSTPTSTPNPSGDTGGHSSETSTELSGVVVGGNDGGGRTIATNPTVNASVYSGGGVESTTTIAGISDEEAARAALLTDFTPFTPGPPDAGGDDYSRLSVGSSGGSDSSVGDVDLFDFPTTAFIPRYGGGPVANDELAASAIVSRSGLSIPQLLFIAVLGLVVLTSMGYAISRTGPGGGGTATPV